MRKINTLLLSFVAFAANAQKLPNKQEASIYAPRNIKIDGKATEWHDEFQAFNKSVGLYYTIANDNENMYLLVRAQDPRVIEKIMDVGVTLVLKVKNVNKQDNKDISITYPLIERKYNHAILINAGDKGNWPGLPHRNAFPEVLTRTDSSVAAANKAFISYANTIKVKGVSDIKDTVISIYNEQHIKTSAFFGNDGLYTYELSFPLKDMEVAITADKQIHYSLRLNSFDHPFLSSYRDPVTREGMEGDPDLNSVTELQGDYKLAKTP